MIVALLLCFYAVIVVLYLAAQGRSAAGKSLAAAIADHENRLRTLEGLPPLPPDSGA